MVHYTPGWEKQLWLSASLKDTSVMTRTGTHTLMIQPPELEANAVDCWPWHTKYLGSLGIEMNSIFHLNHALKLNTLINICGQLLETYVKLSSCLAGRT